MPTLEAVLEYDREHSEYAGSSADEKLLLWSLLHMTKYRSVLEIGVNRGHLTVWLALAMRANDGKLTSVDNYCMQHGGSAKTPIPAKRRLEDLRLQKHVKFVEMDSKEYLLTTKEGQFDFIWIDGDHSYEGALTDIELAVKAKPKMIGVHDVFQGYAGPRNACRTVEEVYSKQGTWIPGKRGIWLYTL